ncbi:MAG: hypothetical protein LBD69_02285 [Puniceicoccales bacterium]|nr:hypothetical protein [Puniceicoccales bacterium]
MAVVAYFNGCLLKFSQHRQSYFEYVVGTMNAACGLSSLSQELKNGCKILTITNDVLRQNFIAGTCASP